jgi:Integrin beta chain VWA domain
MGDVIDAVKGKVNEIIDELRGKASDVGTDLCLGAGDYKDTDHSYIFKNQQAITHDTEKVTDAIKKWKTSSGSTIAEGQLYALDQLAEPLANPEGGSIGWRSGAKRIVVWFGDAPGHDPIRDITEDS